MKKTGCFLLAIIGWLGTAAVGLARFAMSEDVPVERLLANATAVVKANPDSADAHYVIARIHYLAFSRGMGTVPAFPGLGRDGAVRVPAEWMTRGWVESMRWKRAYELARIELGAITREAADEKSREVGLATARHLRTLQEQNWRPAMELSPAQRAEHAAAALAEFQEAMRLSPADGLAALGQACLLEQISDWKHAEQPPRLSPELQQLDEKMVRNAYLKAFQLAYKADASLKFLPVGGGLAGIVSHEAGEGYLRLLSREPAPTSADALARSQVEAGLKRLKILTTDAITPIVFGLRPVAGIDALLSPGVQVDFDLRGYGPTERWPWVRPDTALLVWDPTRTGRIDSGRQLFGGYTFQIFRATGYDALAALDDDGDGVLRGRELAGVRAWFDRNGDGRSTPEEVVDLEALGIVGIAVRATAKEGIHPTNPGGLIFGDGRTLPTWDWMVEPMKN